MQRTASAVDGDKNTGSAVREKVLSDKEAVSTHYDLPPSFFSCFLGPRLSYSCAYFTDENNTLERAEEDKLILTANKLQLVQDECVLDIGCGWGSFMFYAAELGCRVVGTTLSDEQAKFINAYARKRGLANRVRADVVHAYEMDYPPGAFDKIVTIGAVEHMEDLNRVFDVCSELLAVDGLFLVHGMTQPWRSREETIAGIRSEVDDLLEEYFGVGHWHALWELIEALEKNDFEILDHENITNHYRLTVERWLDRLVESEKRIVEGGILPAEKYREFVAFTAAFVFSFSMNNVLCNQVLCRKIKRNTPRPDLPLTRERMVLKGAI